MKELMTLLQVGLLILFATVIPSTASNQACVVSNSSEINPWRWKEVFLTFWIPPRISPDVVFEFQTTFYWEEGNTTINRFNSLLNDETHVRREDTGNSQDGEDIITGVKWRRDIHQGGWLHILLKERFFEFAMVKLPPGSTGEPLVSFSKGNDHVVDSIIFSGNNMTTDCVSGRLVWSVNDSKLIVPLDVNLKIWKFGIQPANKYDLWPVLTLGSVNITMSWNEDQNTVEANTNYGAFEPYTYHTFQIECSSPPSNAPSSPPTEANVTCSLKNDTRVLMRMNLTSWPKYLEVWNDENSQFFFLHDTLGSNDTMVPDDVKVSPGWSGWWPALTILSTSLLILVIALFIVSHRDRQKFDSILRPILPDGFTRYS